MTAGPPKVVFFDIGNVLLHFDPASIARTVAWELRRHPLRMARYLWHSDLGERVELGRVTGWDLFRTFQRELGYGGDYAAFRRLWCEHFTLERRTAGIFARVARKRPVYLLSNTNVLHFEYIRDRYAFVRQARGAILSYELGLRKPDPRIYRAALRRARVAPGDALFIDDLKENIESARRLGLRVLRYTGPEALGQELTALGLLGGGK